MEDWSVKADDSSFALMLSGGMRGESSYHFHLSICTLRRCKHELSFYHVSRTLLAPSFGLIILWFLQPLDCSLPQGSSVTDMQHTRSYEITGQESSVNLGSLTSLSMDDNNNSNSSAAAAAGRSSMYMHQPHPQQHADSQNQFFGSSSSLQQPSMGASSMLLDLTQQQHYQQLQQQQQPGMQRHQHGVGSLPELLLQDLQSDDDEGGAGLDSYTDNGPASNGGNGNGRRTSRGHSEVAAAAETENLSSKRRRLQELPPDERARQSRDRNREHARNTYVQHKLAYIHTH
jgi:hypothetical protein